MITIAYMSCRDNPRFEWFIDSFYKQYNNEVAVEILIIDGSDRFVEWGVLPESNNPHGFTITAPKKTPWQGKNRLTSQEWFAASNARNTAIIYAKGDYLICADDLSVLYPGWWDAALKAYTNKYIVLGAYKKVKNLSVENGIINHYEETPNGNDHRLQYGSRECDGGWLYGCSFGAPIECLVNINGFDEICDSHGYEDTNLGIRLKKRGYRLFYDTQMLTLECEECHSEGPIFRREDPLLTESEYYAVKERMGITGVYQAGGRTDVSHLLMDMVRTETRSDNAWTWGNNFVLSELRETKNFPPIDPEMRHWATGVKLKDL